MMYQGEYTSSTEELYNTLAKDADHDCGSSPTRYTPILRSSASGGTAHSSDWLPKFKQWLPAYLDAVYNRLKDGEVYPLSALKGDFRANCGLDMDHSSLGYIKLSEFIKSLPELCRMKIAVVGNGPATHSVLFPVKRGVASNPVQQYSGTSSSARRPSVHAYGAHEKAPMSPIEKSVIPMAMNSIPAAQNLQQNNDVTYVYCTLCSRWYMESYWLGLPHSRFGICSMCKYDATAYEKWRRNLQGMTADQHRQLHQPQGKKSPLASEEPVRDTVALMSEKLVADKLSVISQELLADKYHQFPTGMQGSQFHVHQLS